MQTGFQRLQLFAAAFIYNIQAGAGLTQRSSYELMLDPFLRQPAADHLSVQSGDKSGRNDRLAKRPKVMLTSHFQVVTD
ncbi:hypothetical protein [Paenibacillus filicis]|uniref:hypothetical protein n=1 Tax=Paenibacillus filicis TaxID=669464 RepID=UPI00311A1396